MKLRSIALGVGIGALAMAGSAFVVTASGPAGATKAPVSAICSSLTGSTTTAVDAAGGPINSLLTGCSGAKATSDGVDTSTVNASKTGGSGTITFLNKKTMTFTYTVTLGSATCGTFLTASATGDELVTFTPTGGTAKITAGGTANLCFWLSNTDGTIYEASTGSVTL